MKATDFLRGKGLSKKNADRIVDLGERGAGKALDETLDLLNFGSKEKRIIVETLTGRSVTLTERPRFLNS